MDLNLARTFLAVVYAGSFVLAAGRLCVSQTTVTARIKNLEEQLGGQLFIRSASGVSLTAAGQRFMPYAQQLLETWEAAQQDMQPRDSREPLRIGADTNLWQPWFSHALGCVRRARPELTARVKVAPAVELLDELEAGRLDVLLSHQPRYRPDVQVELLLEETLIMVRHGTQDGPLILVDWGEAFRQQYQMAFPGEAAAGWQGGVGQLLLQLLLEQGGYGYFRSQVVMPWLENGTLQRVPDTPEFALPVYLLSRSDCTHEGLESVLACMRQLQLMPPADLLHGSAAAADDTGR